MPGPCDDQFLEAIGRLRAWVRDFGSEKDPTFIADLSRVLEDTLNLRRDFSNLLWLLEHEYKRANPGKKVPRFLTIAKMYREAAQLAGGRQ